MRIQTTRTRDAPDSPRAERLATTAPGALPGGETREGLPAVLREIVSKGAVYGLGTSFNGLTAVLLIPFYTSHLDAGEYGVYALAEAVLAFLLVVLGLGMNVAILSRYPGLDALARRQFVGALAPLMICTTLLLDGAFFAAAQLTRPFLVPSLTSNAISLVTAIAAFETLWLLVATLYRAEGWAWRFIVASATQVTVGLSSTVILIAKLGFREEGILWGRLVGDITVFVLFVLPTILRHPLQFRLDGFGSLLRIGLPLLPATLSTMWILTSPRYFIEHYGTVSDVGIYTMSAKVASILNLVFTQPFALTWMVVIFKVFRNPDAGRIYARILTYFVLIGGTLALSLSIASPALASLLGQSRFPLSAHVVTVASLAVVASALMYPLNIGPYVLERTAWQVPAFFASALLITLLGPMMTHRWGIEGAVTALLSTYLFQALLLWLISQRLYRIPVESARLAKVLGVLALAYGGAEATRSHFHTALVNWIAAPAFLLLVPLLLMVIRFPDRGETTIVTSLTTGVARVFKRCLRYGSP